MYLSVKNNILSFRRDNRTISLPIGDMLSKVYNETTSTVIITTVLNSNQKVFTFNLSEIIFPKFNSFKDMKYWFDANVDIVKTSDYLNYQGLLSTLTQGTNITISGNNTTKKITITAIDGDIDGGRAVDTFSDIIDGGSA